MQNNAWASVLHAMRQPTELNMMLTHWPRSSSTTVAFTRLVLLVSLQFAVFVPGWVWVRIVILVALASLAFSEMD